jgi:hypothetical protein
MTSLVLPSANAAMTHLFLEQVSKSFEKYCIVMQVDQAGWHRSNELLVPANIRLIEQPACSLEVNLVEHLWEELREKYLHNRLFLFFLRPIGYCTEALCSGLRILKSNDTKKRPISLILLQKACYRYIKR